MQIEYSISEGDYVTACKLAMRKRSRLTNILLYFVPALGIVLMATTVIALFGGVRWSSVASLFILGLFWLCLPTLLYPFQIRRAYKKAPVLKERRTHTLEHEFVSISSGSLESRTGWNFYCGYAENEKTFLVFQQGNQIFIPLPKRELSFEQITEVRGLFQAHLTSR